MTRTVVVEELLSSRPTSEWFNDVIRNNLSGLSTFSDYRCQKWFDNKYPGAIWSPYYPAAVIFVDELQATEFILTWM